MLSISLSFSGTYSNGCSLTRCFFRLHNTNPRIAAAARAAKEIPIPIPAFAPVLRPPDGCDSANGPFWVELVVAAGVEEAIDDWEVAVEEDVDTEEEEEEDDDDDAAAFRTKKPGLDSWGEDAL